MSANSKLYDKPIASRRATTRRIARSMSQSCCLCTVAGGTERAILKLPPGLLVVFK